MNSSNVTVLIGSRLNLSLLIELPLDLSFINCKIKLKGAILMNGEVALDILVRLMLLFYHFK